MNELISLEGNKQIQSFHLHNIYMMMADCEEVFDPMEITTKRMRHANVKEKGLGARSGNVYVVNCLDFFFVFISTCWKVRDESNGKVNIA